MSPLEPNNHITEGPEYSNIAEVQVKNFKIAFMNMIGLLKCLTARFFSRKNARVQFCILTEKLLYIAIVSRWPTLEN